MGLTVSERAVVVRWVDELTPHDIRTLYWASLNAEDRQEGSAIHAQLRKITQYGPAPEPPGWPNPPGSPPHQGLSSGGLGEGKPKNG
jgi:hypothetical protein